MAKRLFDFTFATLLLVPAIPIILICIFFIRLDAAGPVFFRQTRVGRGFRLFRVFKLRTMACISGSPYTLGEDRRITRPGRILRRYKLDELPQIWNVLRGDMSLVGPRPVVPELADEFRADYIRLLAVRPGLTDPATLRYFCETDLLAHVPDPLTYFKTVATPEKIRISADYIESADLLSDLVLLAKTAVTLLASRSSSSPLCHLPVEPHSLQHRISKLSDHS